MDGFYACSISELCILIYLTNQGNKLERVNRFKSQKNKVVLPGL